MEEKSLQPKTLYPERLSLGLNREIKRQAKVKRRQHHQTSFTTNAKGTSLSRKHKRRERPTQNKPMTMKKVVRVTHDRIMHVKLLQSRPTCRASLIAQLVKEPACDAGDPSSIPGSGRSLGEGGGYPLQDSWPSLVAQTVKNPCVMRETWV